MARKIIDLSVFLENDVISDPPGYRPKIDYIDHETSVPELLDFFPGLKREDLPDEEAWGDRAGRAHHPQRHPPRRALSFRLDDGRWPARDHDRRSLA